MTTLIKIILTGRLSTHPGFENEDLGRIVNTFLMAGFSHVHKQEKVAQWMLLFLSETQLSTIPATYVTNPRIIGTVVEEVSRLRVARV